MTPSDLARAAAQQAEAIACFTREAALIEARRIETYRDCRTFVEKVYARYPAVMSALADVDRVGPGPDRVAVDEGVS